MSVSRQDVLVLAKAVDQAHTMSYNHKGITKSRPVSAGLFSYNEQHLGISGCCFFCFENGVCVFGPGWVSFPPSRISDRQRLKPFSTRVKYGLEPSGPRKVFTKLSLGDTEEANLVRAPLRETVAYRSHRETCSGFGSRGCSSSICQDLVILP